MAVIVDTIDQVWLNIRSAGGSNKESQLPISGKYMNRL